jgi:crooked neck
MSRSLPAVRNRAPAQIQITAEQLVLEAKDRGLEVVKQGAKQFISDNEELTAYAANKRKDFESQIQRHRDRQGLWVRYALWEASLKEFDRSRSVFERALQFNYKDDMMWIKYAEMEMKGKFINHARNIWDRAISLLPRIDQFWYKYTYMEELIGAIESTRAIFERWMQWEPEDDAWNSYINFEMRQGQINMARNIFERYITCHQSSRSYLKYAKWEEKNNNPIRARAIYEKAVEMLPPIIALPDIYLSFASFEEKYHEHDRTRVILNIAADTAEKSGLDRTQIKLLRDEAASFERRHGSAQGAEEAALDVRRKHYENRLLSNPYEYDTWLDLAKLEENASITSNETKFVRLVYSNAIKNIPPTNIKENWKRYIYLWIFWVIYEEMTAKDKEKTREVYNACLKIIPHKQFTFGKIWVMAAEFEIRSQNLTNARKILGTACGKCAHLRKSSIYRKYIALESSLGEIDRCRNIYGKWLEVMPENSAAWIGLASMEQKVGEIERYRAVYELSLQQDLMNDRDSLWQAYIQSERNEGNIIQVRNLYERLLNQMGHVRVWIAYGVFEGGLDYDNDNNNNNELQQHCDIIVMRQVFQRAYTALKDQGLKDERVLLLNAWRECELKIPSGDGDVTIVEAKMPRKVKVKRAIDDGMGVQEMYDYLFPDEQTAKPGLKLLENAMKWKQAAASMGIGSASATAAAADEPAQPPPPAEQELAPPPPPQSTQVQSEELDIDDI